MYVWLSTLWLQLITSVYRRIFRELLGLESTLEVEADNGDMGGDLSHEFHLPNGTAQDRLGVCNACGKASLQQEGACACGGRLDTVGTIEIAHTFQLGTRYAELFGARNERGKPYFMCCFGVGVSRLVAAR